MTETTPHIRPSKHVPGEAGTWIFILGDMCVFAVLFGAFVLARARNPELFDASRRLLGQDHGAINTLLLLTSSLFVVTGMRAIRDHLPVAAPCFAGALLCGLAFVVLKCLEWGGKLHAGHTPSENSFFMYYYILTGLHLFHLLIGMGVLAFLFRQARNPRKLTDQRYMLVEGGACFWHMVDLLWIVLFPLIYLVH